MRIPDFIHQIHIADGFEDDCDALIHRCLQTEKLNFESFCEIWKDMKFDSLYVGRTSPVEIAELSEELIHTAKQFMVANVSNFEETVAGLFLVYGLLNLQPYKGFAVLRLVPRDVPVIKRIEMVARRERRRDVLYILGAILAKHSQFHAEQRERGMEQTYIKYLRGNMGIDRTGFRPKGSFHRQTEELDLIRELSALTDRYEAAKKSVTGGKANPSLSFINTKLAGELNSSLRKLISGIPGLDNDDEDQINEADIHYSRVQAVKDRAMKNAVGSMKHLTSVTDRTSENLESRNESEIRSKPGKVKSSSPIKSYSTPQRARQIGSPRNNTQTKTSPKNQLKGEPKIARASASKTPVKRKRRIRRTKTKKSKKIISDSSSDTDLDFSEYDETSDDEIDLDAFDKPNEDSNTDKPVEIDVLPSRMTAEGDGKIYEIEIIDELANKNVGSKESKETVTDKSVTEFEKEVVDKSIPESINEVANMSEIEEIKKSINILPKGFKKPTKPRLTKPNIALVRMGIMPTRDADGKGETTRQTRSSSKK